MKIVVCIKQVPDTTNVRINPETNTLIREGVESICNPFDEYAIEEALRLKERLGPEPATTIAVTMGPPQAVAVLRDALAMGIDEAILLSDRAFAGSDTWATSYALSKMIERIGDVDLVLCGKQAIDGDTAQVGPGIAVHLGFPQITFVKRIEEITPKKIRAQRMMEEGYQVIESRLPVLLTVVKEINEPRLPSVRGKMRAKKAEIPTWTAADLDATPEYLGLNGSPTVVHKIYAPERKKDGHVLEGEPPEVAAEIVSELKRLSLI
ncbi:MAG: electron transfer flavoprotein subunit beta/FixA family protein [Verrucomicrobia bacterium]|nr:electron transfer flavoprotein subunit beta/FixA family protein [Verrucomicrobiota bacterium]